MNKYTRMNWENTPSTATPLTADNLNHMDEGIERATDGAIALETEITTARGDYADLNARLAADESNISQLESDVETTATNLATKANKSDISQINSRLQSAETTLKNKANTADVSNSLASKYDSSNIESGSATLTPHNTQTEKSKSATCIYKKVGDTVFASIAIVMNACTLSANSALHFIDLPFRHNSEVPVYFMGINNKGTAFKGVVPKGSTWFQLMSTTAQTYTFTDGEQLNFTLMCKI